MAKTKEILFNCSEVRAVSFYNKMRVIIDDPNIDELLSCVSMDDLIAHVVGNDNKPEDVFDEEALVKWAEENGYTKEQTND
jgi:hypothetical protein